LPIEPNISIATEWSVSMQEDSIISGRVGIENSLYYGVVAPTITALFTVQVLKISPIPSGIHSLDRTAYLAMLKSTELQ
jgi:hypothetical protein